MGLYVSPRLCSHCYRLRSQCHTFPLCLFSGVCASDILLSTSVSSPLFTRPNYFSIFSMIFNEKASFHLVPSPLCLFPSARQAGTVDICLTSCSSLLIFPCQYRRIDWIWRAGIHDNKYVTCCHAFICCHVGFVNILFVLNCSLNGLDPLSIRNRDGPSNLLCLNVNNKCKYVYKIFNLEYIVMTVLRCCTRWRRICPHLVSITINVFSIIPDFLVFLSRCTINSTLDEDSGSKMINTKWLDREMSKARRWRRNIFQGRKWEVSDKTGRDLC